MAEPSLADALAAAASAGPSERIGHRDGIVAFGEEAVDPVAAWLADPRLGAFAVRVLERLAREPASGQRAIDALVRARRSTLPEVVAGDVDEALTRLQVRLVRPMRRRSPSTTAAPVGRPGRPGRGYWATHTWERTEHGREWRHYVWAELQRGRLRQGWGWDASQDLRRLQSRVDAGIDLEHWEQQAWRARRMLTGRSDAIHVDDLVIAVAVPEPHTIVVARVIGPYEFALDASVPDYGHLLPVELLGGPVDRSDPRVSDALRHAVLSRVRLWRIDRVGGDVEDLIAAARAEGP